MLMKPVTENCAKNLNFGAHVCFGISPFNSYFSEARIQELASWGKKEFDTMHFFVPDIPSAYTLEALGYSPEKAAWKARRQAQYLHNKIHRALSNIGYPSLDAYAMILNWEKLSANEAYTSLHATILETFEKDLSFHQVCLEASRWVLEKRVPDTQTLSREALSSAVRYLLTEIPLFLDTASIVGKDSSVFCYHQEVAFIADLFHGKLPVSPSPKQGFVVVEPIQNSTFETLPDVQSLDTFSENQSAPTPLAT